MNKKLTLRQVLTAYLLITVSPVIRDVPYTATKASSSAAYVTPIISLVMLCVLIFILHTVLKRHKGKNIYDIIDFSAGGVCAKIVVFLYAVWALVSAAVYIQYYAFRFRMTIMPYTGSELFLCVILALSFLAFRKNLKTICRISEICFPIIIIILAALIILAIPVINVQNLKITDWNAKNVLRGGADIGAVGGYLVLVLFFGDRLAEPEKFKKSAVKYAALFFVLTTAIITVTVGINGAALTSRLPLPFFTTVKQISSFGVVERVEPLLISVWMLSDFVIISIFTAVLMLCIKWLLGLERISFLMIPILICMYRFTQMFAGSLFELEYYTMKIMPVVNIVFQYVLPLGIILFCRKKHTVNP